MSTLTQKHTTLRSAVPQSEGRYPDPGFLAEALFYFFFSATLSQDSGSEPLSLRTRPASSFVILRCADFANPPWPTRPKPN